LNGSRRMRPDRRFRSLATIALIVLLSGCAGSAGSGLKCETPTGQDPALGSSFDLRFGERSTLAGESLTLTFVDVLEESRCPAGVQCIWEGNARVGVKAEKPPSRPATLALNTSGRYDREATYQGYRVQLLTLLPHPAHGQTLQATDYCANLKIVRAQAAGT
jgi:hypothetical protein